MDSTDKSYDFIIVGAGPAGCVLASRLAKALKHLEILLIDAGGTNADPSHQTYGERFWTFVTAAGYNWGYKTVPQEHLDGRELDYSRGKGLGGSTAINFCVYTRGPKADYEQWAKLVGDETWTWEHTLARFKKLETFGSPLKEYGPFVDPTAAAHGYEGPLNIGLPHIWDDDFGKFFDLLTETYPKNLDQNDGNPLGLAVGQVSALDGRRTTAVALLAPLPTNLTILTDSAAEKVIFEGRKAIGIEVSGKKIRARKEVILSAGAIDTPKLLLLSGIGPKDELAEHKIPVIQNLSGVGKNMHDHLWLELVTVQKPGTHHRSSYINSPQALEEARAQWMKDKTGSLGGYYLPQIVAYLKSRRALASKEFQELDEAVQRDFQDETRPNFELISHCQSFSVQAPETYLGYAVAFMGGQSAGEVKLRSSDPKDPPVVDPKFLAHPFDRRVAVESVREALELLDQQFLAKDQVRLAAGPAGRSDEEILNYVRSTGISMWHMCGTAKMGKSGDPGTCVDKDFHVIGVQGLRVVDMSVAPLMPNAHTQAVAYVVGATAADKIIAEYS